MSYQNDNNEQQVKQLNKKQNIRARKKAYKLWAESEGSITYIRLAELTNLTIDELKRYKGKDKWLDRFKKDRKNGVFQKRIEEETKKIQYKTEIEEEFDEANLILENSGLPDRRKLFIMYYLQSFNITQAAKKAGYSAATAHVRGFSVIKDPKVVDTLNKLKAIMHKNIYISAHDVLNEYIKIAYADITDYVEFDGKTVQMKPSDQVDGRLITEVKQGRDGITIKLADKMKALDRLEKLFEVIPDKKLELDREKFEFTKKLADKELGTSDGRVTIVNDIRMG